MPNPVIQRDLKMFTVARRRDEATQQQSEKPPERPREELQSSNDVVYD